MTSKQKRALYQILAGVALFVAALFIPVENTYLKLAIFAAPYLLLGYDVLLKAIKGVINRQWLDENFLMCIATIGAFCVGEYAEGVAVMLFYRVGELFESYAVGKSRRSIAGLMEIRPDEAFVERDGAVVQVDPSEVEVGETIVIRPGEKVPIDGTIIEGSTTLDTTALTGESAPRAAGVGADVISGCINRSGLIRVRVTKPFGESTVSKILEMVENASSRKAKTEAFITRFARYYTPIVVAAALILAIVPPLFVGNWSEWIHRALIFLVVSCPCALVISVPMSFFGGIGGASRQGILIKGSNYLEALSQVETIAFDKTGTLTEGSFGVSSVTPANGISAEELIQLAAQAECHSTHPIASSLLAAAQQVDPALTTNVTEIAGHGLTASVGGATIAAGNRKLMASLGIEAPPAADGTTVFIARDNVYIGQIGISDKMRPGARKALEALKEAGVKRTVMLTGDAESVAARVAGELGLGEYHASLLPGDKVQLVESLIDEPHEGMIAFVGDGINDAPVLSRVDVGIAMGVLGSDAAIEAADVVLMDDDLSKLAKSIKIAKRTMRIVRQNIVFALAVKIGVMILGTVGIANMWMAVFADVGVSVLAILNAMRCLAGSKE